jgi:hypothetical protein
MEQPDIYDKYLSNKDGRPNPIKRILEFDKSKEQLKSLQQWIKENYGHRIEFENILEQTIDTNKIMKKTFSSLSLLKTILERNKHMMDITDDNLDKIFKKIDSMIVFYQKHKDDSITIDFLNTIAIKLHSLNNELDTIKIKANKKIKDFNKKQDYMNIVKCLLILKSTYDDIYNFILISKAEFDEVYVNPYYKEHLFTSKKSSSDVNNNSQIINSDFFEYPNHEYDKYENKKYTLKLFNDKLLLRLKRTIVLLQNLLLNNLHIFKYYKFNKQEFDAYKGRATLNELVKYREIEYIINSSSDDGESSSDDIRKFKYDELTPGVINELFKDIINFLRNKNKITKTELIDLYKKLEIIIASFKVNLKTIINIDQYKDNLKIGDFTKKYKDYKNFIRYITILNKLEIIIFIAFINKYENDFTSSRPSSLSARSSARDYIDDFNIDQTISKKFGKKIILNKMFKQINMREPLNAFKVRNRFTNRAIRVA